ncbi:MAG: type II toxin-antitoxin system RelE/ParE family toxin [Oscillospiraceae bacterium]|nr:type II toxin-antitoxin system RelE/ParE family toxin [Oscillospiraceae bacterium]
MAYEVGVSESAERDLDEILKYMVDELSNPKAAADFADELDERYVKLEEYPFMYELSRNERLARLGYRRFVMSNYVALYLVNEENQIVTIARIFYGKRDYEKYI